MDMSKLEHLFADIFQKDVKTKPVKYVEVKQYSTVPEYDWEVVSVINPHLKTGPWIAGGAALNWWQGNTVGESDVDVFCRDSQQADRLIERIKKYERFTVKYESDNAITLDYWLDSNYEHRWTVQVIKRRYFKSLEEVINSFDISVCQIGTSGNDWALGENTAKDIEKRLLRFQKPLQPDTVKRLVKYWVYGYRPVDGTIDDILNTDLNWQFHVDDIYQNAF